MYDARCTAHVRGRILLKSAFNSCACGAACYRAPSFRLARPAPHRVLRTVIEAQKRVNSEGCFACSVSFADHAPLSFPGLRARSHRCQICDVAAKEYSLEEALAQMKAEWEPIQFDLMVYGSVSLRALRLSAPPGALLRKGGDGTELWSQRRCQGGGGERGEDGAATQSGGSHARSVGARSRRADGSAAGPTKRACRPKSASGAARPMCCAVSRCSANASTRTSSTRRPCRFRLSRSPTKTPSSSGLRASAHEGTGGGWQNTTQTWN